MKIIKNKSYLPCMEFLVCRFYNHVCYFFANVLTHTALRSGTLTSWNVQCYSCSENHINKSYKNDMIPNFKCRCDTRMSMLQTHCDFRDQRILTSQICLNYTKACTGKSKINSVKNALLWGQNPGTLGALLTDLS